MSSPFLNSVNGRITLLVFWIIWATIHAVIVHWYGMSWGAAIMDSAISNLLLAAFGQVILITFRYYVPAKNPSQFLIVLCLSLSTFWILLTRLTFRYLLPPDSFSRQFFYKSLPLRLSIAFLCLACIALLSMLWYTLKEQQNTLQRQAEVEGLAREAELSKLRQQLQPHFLFNSLNSINALIVSKPIQARTMIQQLSAFLRGTLKRENETWNTLDEELAHLELYLSIEQVRFGHRLKVDIENSVEQNVKLPSMVLQPLLENAIKFGLYDTVDIVKIEINAQMNEGLLIISISNPFDAETSGPANGLGFGLSGVSRRLQLLFARTDLLGISSSGDIFTTTIKIPQQ